MSPSSTQLALASRVDPPVDAGRAAASGRGRLRDAARLTLAVLCLLVALPLTAQAQAYGRTTAEPVGPFLNGVFPSSTPEGEADWSIVPAFPSLAATGVPTVTVIVPNPSDDRIYVGSRDGQIASFENDPTVATFEPFMDIRDRVAVVNDGGFLGLMFHPEFGTPGSDYALTFYTWTSSYCPTDAAGDVDFGACDPNYPPGEPLGFFGVWLRLSRYQAYWDAGAGVYRGDPTTEEPMINMRLYNNSHYGGGPIFGNDGYLYVAIGDHYRYETAQDIVNTLEGGTIRIAVDITENPDGSWNCPTGSHLPRRFLQTVTGNADEVSGRLYCIPDDNPWLDPAGGLMEEYWAIGQRNPHRITIDRVTGNLWSGEVGEISREEVNVIRKGHNYGWPFREGKIPGPRPEPPSYVGILTEPVVDFLRSEAESIIGGYVYRGSEYPELVGRYITGCWELNYIYAVDLDETTWTGTKEEIATFTPGGLATFGEDNDNELLLGSVSNAIPLQKLVRAGAGAPDPPPFLSQLGAFSDLATLTPVPAALPFEPDKFWSDGAAKSRWLFLPNDGTHDQPDEQIGFSEVNPWTWPTGTVLMKHFELPTDELDPTKTTRLETRFLVHGTDAWYGVTYRWRPDQLEADLLAEAETGVYSIDLAGGGTQQQTWTFPSRGDCLQCHNTGEGGPAGPHTHQLNRNLTFPSTGVTDNQLRTWNHLGMFSPSIVEADIPTYHEVTSVLEVTASLEDRARSYLDTNCSYCHRPETGNRAPFDARLTTPLADQGLIWGGVIDDMGLVDPYLVKPGDATNSLLYHRASLTDAAGGMPPIAKALVDTVGAGVLAAWIDRVDPGYPKPGLVYEYYEETGMTQLPDFTTLTPVETGAAGLFDISARDRDDDFAFRFTGVVEVPTAGSWTFYTTSDEGSQLFIDGVLVVDNDGLPMTATEASGAITLSAGYHDIVVTMFEATGTEVLNVDWEGPGVARQILPASRLFQETPSLSPNTPPVLTDPGPQSDTSSSTVSLQLVATDADLDALYYSAEGLPRGLSLDASTGLITGDLTYATPGVSDVTLGVSDGPDASSTTIVWTVVDDTPPDLDLLFPTDGATLPPIALTIDAYAADAGGIASVQFYLDGAPLGGALSSAPFEMPWDASSVPDGAYTLSVEALDTAGNGSTDAVTVTVDRSVPIGAWSFDEGAGILASDGSGRGHDGTVSGALWDPSGRFNGALAFDGVDDVVTVPYASDLDFPTAFTLMAWVRPTVAAPSWAVAMEKSPDAYVLLTSSLGGNPGGSAQLGGVCCSILLDTSPLAVDVWTHIAVTYDGAQLELFRDGASVATMSATGLVETGPTDLLIGNSSYAGQAFEGLIDEVRVYARDLDAAEILTLSTTPIGSPDPDVTPPTVTLSAPAPGSLVGAIPVSATASDDRGVIGVQFLLDGVPLGAEDTTPPWEITWNTTTTPNGAYALAARARDAAGNTTTSASVAVTVSNPVDTTPPSVSVDAPLDGATVSQNQLLVASASDAGTGVTSVQFLLDGAPLGAPITAPPWELGWNTGLQPNGVYAISARAEDAAGNTADAAAVDVTVANVGPVPVASWAFDGTSPSTAVDDSGNGHDGTITGALRDPAGRFGGALAFDGLTDVVIVPWASELDLASGFTLMAWVKPSAAAGTWSVVFEKAVDTWFLLADSPSGLPGGGSTIGGSCCPIAYAGSALPVDTWSHLVLTYDGAQLEVYVDGVSEGTQPATGLVETGPTDLRIGNSNYAGQGFAGWVDEVRLFDQALSPGEIVALKDTPVPEPGFAAALGAGGLLLGGLGRWRRRRRGDASAAGD